MIQVLERAFTILELLRPAERSLAFLTHQTGLAKPTLHNILKTLEALEVVRRTEGGKYALGAKLVRLAEPQMKQGTLEPVARVAAERLAETIRETVLVSVLSGGERYVVAQAEGRQSLTVQAGDVHKDRSPYSIAMGRVLLAYLDAEALQEVVAARGLPGAEWDGIKSQKALETALKEIRREGGIAFQRSEDGQVQMVALPVYGPDETVWASVGVHLPASRFTIQHEDRIVFEMKKTVEEIQHGLDVAYGRSRAMGQVQQ